MPDRRLRAVWDMKVPVIRELAGVHEYDGVVMDLSPSGRKAALERLGTSSPGEQLADRHDERHLSAPEPQRLRAREAHLAQWPEAVDASLESLQAVPAPVADALLPAVRGLGEGILGTTDVEVAALEAHARLLGRIQNAAVSGDPDAS